MSQDLIPGESFRDHMEMECTSPHVLCLCIFLFLFPGMLNPHRPSHPFLGNLLNVYFYLKNYHVEVSFDPTPCRVHRSYFDHLH